MNITRRLALSRIFAGSAAAAAATAVAVAAPVAAREESRAYFEHPAEYLAAMQAIGWRPVAMYQQTPDGSAHRMGVAEHAPSQECERETRGKFHAISMRAPVQLAMDTHPGGWWGLVWQYLYDKGLREDVTPRRTASEPSEGGDA